MKYTITPDKSCEPAERSDMFVMKEGSAWITAGSISIRINHSETKVTVTLLPFGHELDGPLAETWVTQFEARQRIRMLKEQE